MRILKNPAFLCGALLVCSALPSGAAPSDRTEPAAEYTLEVNGQKVPLTLGNETASKVGGQTLRFKLSRQPFRQFKKSGVQFDYPATYSFEADDSEPSATVWTIAQGDSTLILNRFDKLPLPELSSVIIQELTRQFGAKNVKISSTTLFLNGKSRAGKRLDVLLAGQTLVQEVFAFETAKNSFVMVLQDVPSNGKPSPESIKLKALIARSLKW